MVAITEIATPFPRRAPESVPGRHRPRHPHLRAIPGTDSPGSQVSAAGGRASTIAIVILAGLLAVAGLVYLLTADPLAAPGTIAADDVTYTVVEGDTMWSISQELAPAGEAGQFVERLVALNGTSVVEAGQELAVPVG